MCVIRFVHKVTLSILVITKNRHKGFKILKFQFDYEKNESFCANCKSNFKINFIKHDSVLLNEVVLIIVQLTINEMKCGILELWSFELSNVLESL
ncbi:hypothetical protein A0128_14825 [Leptospira tipperaryensis]|uniref:Uncharacterized protein n=1 Tax=Leptospira tipperaryensis TaxID=2564040 RepID=A0A1D7UZK3_9LEPT|nr:hypothetical protein A0128_14825 [Leptospira tipperaryensis]